MIIIPAIDIIGGKCVRLSQGKFSTANTYGNPLEIAKAFAANGCTHLHLVDLDGARQGKTANLRVLETIAAQTTLQIDFSGGIKTDADLQSVFDAGAAVAGIGSIAVKQPAVVQQWIAKYGTEKIWIGADVQQEMIAINGWQEQTRLNVFDFIQARITDGAGYMFCTDISKDGMLQGPAVALYRKIIKAFPGLKLIASGGISSVRDIEALTETGCYAVIIGKALYEGKISFSALKKYLS